MCATCSLFAHDAVFILVSRVFDAHIPHCYALHSARPMGRGFSIGRGGVAHATCKISKARALSQSPNGCCMHRLEVSGIMAGRSTNAIDARLAFCGGCPYPHPATAKKIIVGESAEFLTWNVLSIRQGPPGQVLLSHVIGSLYTEPNPVQNSFSTPLVESSVMYDRMTACVCGI